MKIFMVFCLVIYCFNYLLFGLLDSSRYKHTHTRRQRFSCSTYLASRDRLLGPCQACWSVCFVSLKFIAFENILTKCWMQEGWCFEFMSLAIVTLRGCCTYNSESEGGMCISLGFVFNGLARNVVQGG